MKRIFTLILMMMPLQVLATVDGGVLPDNHVTPCTDRPDGYKFTVKKGPKAGTYVCKGGAAYVWETPKPCPAGKDCSTSGSGSGGTGSGSGSGGSGSGASGSGSGGSGGNGGSGTGSGGSGGSGGNGGSGGTGSGSGGSGTGGSGGTGSGSGNGNGNGNGNGDSGVVYIPPSNDKDKDKNKDKDKKLPTTGTHVRIAVSQWENGKEGSYQQHYLLPKSCLNTTSFGQRSNCDWGYKVKICGADLQLMDDTSGFCYRYTSVYRASDDDFTDDDVTIEQDGDGNVTINNININNNNTVLDNSKVSTNGSGSGSDGSGSGGSGGSGSGGSGSDGSGDDDGSGSDGDCNPAKEVCDGASVPFNGNNRDIGEAAKTDVNDFSVTQYFRTNAVCPAPIYISLGIFGTMEISYQWLCRVAQAMRGVVIAFAWLSAVLIIVKGTRGT